VQVTCAANDVSVCHMNAVLAHPLGDVLLSQDPAVQVPSALEGLTVVFEMGTCGSPPPSPPNGCFADDVSLNRFSSVIRKTN
jgi:hypothetical protein